MDVEQVVDCAASQIALPASSSPRGSERGDTASATDWRGMGGRTLTPDSADFDRQLDKISIWLDLWDHKQRCTVVDEIVTWSSCRQLCFLWTVIQPALHRDFTYAANSHFPPLHFTPISTYISRRIKKKRARHLRYYRVHREPSAYLPERRDVTGSSNVVRLPHLASYLESLPVSDRSTGSHRSRVSTSLPSLTEGSVVDQSPRDALVQTAIFDGTAKQTLQWLYDAPPCLRFIEMPVRRHVQDETSGQCSQMDNSQSKRNKEECLHLRATRKTNKGLKEGNQTSNVCLPEGARLLLHWYTSMWNERQRNEFLHKLLLKLDPRQHYYVSSLLSVRQFCDFLLLLPERLAMKILSYLSPCQILIASQVSRHWHRLCNNNVLWRQKCDQGQLDVPVTGSKPQWKALYMANVRVKRNWLKGHCNVINCEGHSDRVLSVTFHLTQMATGGGDHTIRIWRLPGGLCIRTLVGHRRGVWCLRFVTDSLLLSGSYDCTIKVWNLKKGRCIRTLLSHTGPVWAVVCRHKIFASASQDQTAKVWDISRSRLLHTLTGHTAAVFAIDMSDTGAVVITGSADRSVRLWSTSSGLQRRVIWASQTTSIMAVSYSGGHLACSFGSTISVYRLHHTKPAVHIRTYQEHKKRVETLELFVRGTHPLDATLLSAGQDGVLKCWHLNMEKSLHTFRGHHGQVNCVHIDRTKIASASYDNIIKIWDFNVP